jgi:septal ring factor EnvC (AmiA/AmiB activator)
MLAGVRDLRELGRATRAVSSLVHLNERRIQEHRTRLEALRAERESVRQRAAALQAAQTAAEKARDAADRAVAARAGLLAQIDRRRDLNARLAGELQVAQQRLEQAVQTLEGTTAVETVSVPMAPFRGVLDWPAAGRVTRRFGQGDRTVGGGVKNGIEIAVAEQAPVQAVHSGTIGFAGVFPGYGTLVIVDHGAEHYSLYGYLAAATVERGQRVLAGAELGRAGYAPAGGAALYFEVRIDGDPVDPVQWLKPR